MKVNIFFGACSSIVVSAALVRIFGKDVAELPLVATDRENQGKVSLGTLFYLKRVKAEAFSF